MLQHYATLFSGRKTSYQHDEIASQIQIAQIINHEYQELRSGFAHLPHFFLSRSEFRCGGVMCFWALVAESGLSTIK